MQQRFFDSDGVRLQTLDWGGVGQALVLLAGLGDTAQIYRGLAPKLTGRLRVVGLTRRGHGQSDHPTTGYNLDTFVQDVRRFLDVLGVERAVLVGHSYGGLEITRFAARYAHRVTALVYLDALFPRLDPEPDLSDDPVWTVIPTEGPSEEDLASREAYLSYYRRARPAWARIWCPAIEANLMERVTTLDNCSLEFHHDDALMDHIYRETWLTRCPEYDQVSAPMLAIVPDGETHQACPPDATDEFRQAADLYWRARIRPWIRQRSAAFLQAAPTARVIELDSPYHHIFIAQEDATVKAITCFLTDE